MEPPLFEPKLVSLGFDFSHLRFLELPILEPISISLGSFKIPLYYLISDLVTTIFANVLTTFLMQQDKEIHFFLPQFLTPE